MHSTSTTEWTIVVHKKRKPKGPGYIPPKDSLVGHKENDTAMPEPSHYKCKQTYKEYDY